MPGYKKHLSIGSIVFAGLSALILYMGLMPITSLLIAAPLFLIYTLLPDVDTPASKIRKAVEVTILITIIVLLVAFEQTKIPIVLIIILIVFWFSKHRGAFHSILTGFPLALPVILYDTNIGILCYIGFLTHLIADKLFKN